MTATFLPLDIPGAFVAVPQTYRDARGTFFESWRSTDYAAAGTTDAFEQDNVSISTRNVLRGLHYQVGRPQGQLVTVLRGTVLDVLVDVRVGSPTFGVALSFELDEEEPKQIYMPPGVAHGFCVLSEEALLHYKCTRTYEPEHERGLRWDDPELAISWPVRVPIVSDRDANYPLLSQIGKSDLPRYSGLGSPAARSIESPNTGSP